MCLYEESNESCKIGEQTSVFLQATDQHHSRHLEAQPSLPVQPKK